MYQRNVEGGEPLSARSPAAATQAVDSGPQVKPTRGNAQGRNPVRDAADAVYLSPALPDHGPVDVAYARYSTENQREDSIPDQFRAMRERLPQWGLDPDAFIYMADAAISGQKDDRPELNRIMDLVKAGRLRNLVVIHQDRFSRGVNVSAMVKDIVFSGGRFISLGEGLDTKTTPNWQLQVGVLGVLNNQFVLKIQERSHEGMVGRHLDPHGSTGHYPYGYRSVPEDAGATKAAYSRRRRCKIEIEVVPGEADLVRRVYELFTKDNYSIAKIVAWVEAHRREYPPLHQNGGEKPVYAAYIRSMLRNPKYIGRWHLGLTGTLYNSVGVKGIVKKNASDVVWSDRPHARIISDELWNAAQAKHAKLREIYGYRTHHTKKRGPREHYRVLYAKSLLPGLAFCGHCGGKLLAYSSRDKRLNCKASRTGACSNNVTLPLERAEKAVLGAFCDLIKNISGWAPQTIEGTRQKVLERLAIADGDRARLAAQRDDAAARLANVVRSIEEHGYSKVMHASLDRLETTIVALDAQIADIDELRSSAQTLPDEAWFREKLDTLARTLNDDLPKVAHVIRRFIERIEAVPMQEKWQKRGSYRLRVTFSLPAGLAPMLSGSLASGVASMAGEALPKQIVTEIDLSGEKLKGEDFRRIEAMLASGKNWTAVGRDFGMAAHWVKTLYGRWKGDS